MEKRIPASPPETKKWRESLDVQMSTRKEMSRETKRRDKKPRWQKETSVSSICPSLDSPVFRFCPSSHTHIKFAVTPPLPGGIRTSRDRGRRALTGEPGLSTVPVALLFLISKRFEVRCACCGSRSATGWTRSGLGRSEKSREEIQKKKK
jgi:hypothetical protein